MSDPDIARARARTLLARERLAEALATLKLRLAPKVLARNAALVAKDKAANAAVAGVEAAKARPAITAGIAALAALVLARKPITRAISEKSDETGDGAARSPANPSRKAK